MKHAAVKYIQWQALIQDMETAGWKPIDIALALNIPPTTLSSWKHENKEPRYSCGEAILNLHTAIFGAAHTQKRITLFRESAIKPSVVAGQ